MALVELGYDDLLPAPVFKPISEEEENNYSLIGTLDDDFEIQAVKKSLVALIEAADGTLIIPLSSMVETFLHQDKRRNYSIPAKKINKVIQNHIGKLYGYRH